MDFQSIVVDPGRILEPLPLGQLRLSVAAQELRGDHQHRCPGAGRLPGPGDSAHGGLESELRLRGAGGADPGAHRGPGESDRYHYDQLLQGLGLAQRELTAADLDRALESRSLRSALEGWAELTKDEAANRLDRVIVYDLIEQAEFTLAQVLELLTRRGYQAAPEQVKESLTRLERAFIIGRSQDRFRWQVPLWRERVRAEEPRRMLERELGG